MDPWINELGDDLERLASNGLLRKLKPVEPDGGQILVRGQRLWNLASNDYLALSTHPALQKAAIQAIEQSGVGAGSSRLVSGHRRVHELAERRFATLKHAEAGLLFPTGFMANLAVLGALAGPGDLICADKLNHASLLDGARASGAESRIYPHRSLEKLARLLERHRDAKGMESGRPTRRFIVTDSVFSMDGDVADLPSLCDLADRFDAILVVDEAHGTGVLGANGGGLAELQGVSERVDVVISTASKALGGLGGIVTARDVVIQTLVNRARSLIYTTGVPAAQAACIVAALDVIRDEPQRRERLLLLSRVLRDRLIERRILDETWRQGEAPTPIIPIIVGDPHAALALGAHLEAHEFFAPAIRAPTVAPNSARVRLSLRVDFPMEQVDRLVEVIAGFREWGS